MTIGARPARANLLQLEQSLQAFTWIGVAYGNRPKRTRIVRVCTDAGAGSQEELLVRIQK